MIVSIVYPSGTQHTGGVVAMYEYGNALARRGHEVHLVHGPAWPVRVDSVEELAHFRFEPEVHHHIVDTLDDPSLPEGDVVFPATAPRRLGLPASFFQGYGLLGADVENAAMRSRAPKVCVARWLVDVGRAQGVADEQLWHIPYGIDHEQFRPGDPGGARPVDVACLYHPHPEKGWGDALAALERLRAHRPELTVRAFAIIRPSEPLPPWVDLRIGRDHAQLVEEVYRQAKVFLQASLREGFGFTAVEAMACGAALVTTDNGGSRDYAVPGETALVVPPGDPERMAEALQELLGDTVERERLAAAGERYVRRFDWDVAGERLEAHLEAYVADPAAFQAAPAPVANPGTDLPGVGRSGS